MALARKRQIYLPVSRVRQSFLCKSEVRRRKPAWLTPDQTGRNLAWPRLVFQAPAFNIALLNSLAFSNVNTLYEAAEGHAPVIANS